MIRLTDKGLYCPAGDFYIDPWHPVPRAVITHAHADHARPACERYFAASPGLSLLKKRVGRAAIVALKYTEVQHFGPVSVSLHPAGHVLGSAQVRVAHAGQVWVVSGDFKRQPDPTCAPFEVVPCDAFITETTFARPQFRWPDTSVVAQEVLSWWQGNRRRGVASVLFCYALGKAQRLLAELARLTDEPAFCHGAVESVTRLYRKAGIALLPTRRVEQSPRDYAGELVIAPPGAHRTPWMRRFGDSATGFCSGWMLVPGQQRERGYDRGFVISDHADWPALVRTIRETGARRVYTIHGESEALIQHMNEQGVRAAPLDQSRRTISTS